MRTKTATTCWEVVGRKRSCCSVGGGEMRLWQFWCGGPPSVPEKAMIFGSTNCDNLCRDRRGRLSNEKHATTDNFPIKKKKVTVFHFVTTLRALCAVHSFMCQNWTGKNTLLTQKASRAQRVVNLCNSACCACGKLLKGHRFEPQWSKVQSEPSLRKAQSNCMSFAKQSPW